MKVWIAALAGLLAVAGCAASKEGPVKAAELTVGAVAPEFTAESTQGRISLAELRGKQVVLYFYPKDATPG